MTTKYGVNVGLGAKRYLQRADDGALIITVSGVTYTAAKTVGGYKLTNSLNNETRYASSIKYVVATIEGWALRFDRIAAAVERREAHALGLPADYVHQNYGASRGLNRITSAHVYTAPSNPTREGTAVTLKLTADVETAAKILAMFPALQDVADDEQEEAHA